MTVISKKTPSGLLIEIPSKNAAAEQISIILSIISVLKGEISKDSITPLIELLQGLLPDQFEVEKSGN